jgi:hypothetical protein
LGNPVPNFNVRVSLRQKKLVITQAAMMDGEEGTTKYAEGAKMAAKVLFKDENYRNEQEDHGRVQWNTRL